MPPAAAGPTPASAAAGPSREDLYEMGLQWAAEIEARDLIEEEMKNLTAAGPPTMKDEKDGEKKRMAEDAISKATPKAKCGSD